MNFTSRSDRASETRQFGGTGENHGRKPSKKNCERRSVSAGSWSGYCPGCRLRRIMKSTGGSWRGFASKLSRRSPWTQSAIQQRHFVGTEWR